jgi:hypothetical protein
MISPSSTQQLLWQTLLALDKGKRSVADSLLPRD